MHGLCLPFEAKALEQPEASKTGKVVPRDQRHICTSECFGHMKNQAMAIGLPHFEENPFTYITMVASNCILHERA